MAPAVATSVVGGTHRTPPRLHAVTACSQCFPAFLRSGGSPAGRAPLGGGHHLLSRSAEIIWITITANTSTKNRLNSRPPNRPRVSRESPRMPGSSTIRGRGGGPGGLRGTRGFGRAGVAGPGVRAACGPATRGTRDCGTAGSATVPSGADDDPSSERTVTPADGRPGSLPDRGAWSARRGASPRPKRSVALPVAPVVIVVIVVIAGCVGRRRHVAARDAEHHRLAW
jgi:hypothetical protein